MMLQAATSKQALELNHSKQPLKCEACHFKFTSKHGDSVHMGVERKELQKPEVLRRTSSHNSLDMSEESEKRDDITNLPITNSTIKADEMDQQAVCSEINKLDQKMYFLSISHKKLCFFTVIFSYKCFSSPACANSFPAIVSQIISVKRG